VGKHVTPSLTSARMTQKIQSSEWPKMTIVLYDVPPIVGQNLNSNAPKDHSCQFSQVRL